MTIVGAFQGASDPCKSCSRVGENAILQNVWFLFLDHLFEDFRSILGTNNRSKTLTIGIKIEVAFLHNFLKNFCQFWILFFEILVTVSQFLGILGPPRPSWERFWGPVVIFYNCLWIVGTILGRFVFNLGSFLKKQILIRATKKRVNR